MTETTDKVRVVVVDDSAAMRALLTKLLNHDPMIEVVGQAPEPHAAREMIKALNPDVVTLDVEMPGMDGLSFLERIMRLRPMPVVMCSTLTARGTEATIEALRLGAVDCIAKPSGNPLEIAQDGALLRKMVKTAARSSVRAAVARPVPGRVVPANPAPAAGPMRDVVIAIGASTGGVEALFTIIGALPVDCPPVLVVQHMPAIFTGGFAARLDREARVTVVEAKDGMPLKRGTVYLAPGGSHHMELVGGTSGHVRLVASDPVGGHRPSVDVLFNSVARLGSRAVGVILTGMGADGAEGLSAMRAGGARTLGQSRETCVVYGMPRAAFERGAVEKEVNLSAMPEAILAACRR
ncbi:two-component system chemotaxis response regulator CheB [Novosphingobium sp. PhB165]|uniref:protein-glutamate methylesterase/protein-glutamine glutaminase n=1 Tax=Novosphingobium sp. PhB165 TaxID=2485105 RepID=UPI00104C1669|nr:chemotaxis response regulator protein-glutamate methylesterase [Novosphingobium sp. PhB165]TCM17720.1 two-component system chemotaxis response regulator CheB [Novosphingobium sp. PhB165]